MYFVDATMIRKVDQNGIISTLLRTNDLTAVRPLSCDSSMDVSQVRPAASWEPAPPLRSHTPAQLIVRRLNGVQRSTFRSSLKDI